MMNSGWPEKSGVRMESWFEKEKKAGRKISLHRLAGPAILVASFSGNVSLGVIAHPAPLHKKTPSPYEKKPFPKWRIFSSSSCDLKLNSI